MRVQTKGEPAGAVASRSLDKLAKAADIIARRFDTALASFEEVKATEAEAEADSDE
jgi:hypothetical protein